MGNKQIALALLGVMITLHPAQGREFGVDGSPREYYDDSRERKSNDELRAERTEIVTLASTKEKQRAIRLKLKPLQEELEKIVKENDLLLKEKTGIEQLPVDPNLKDFAALSLQRNQLSLERLAKAKEKLEQEMASVRTDTEASGEAVQNLEELVNRLQAEVYGQGLDRRIDHFGQDVHEAIVKSLMIEKRLDERLLGLYVKTKFERVLSSPLFCKATQECKKPAADRERVKLDALYFTPAGARGANEVVTPEWAH